MSDLKTGKTPHILLPVLIISEIALIAATAICLASKTATSATKAATARRLISTLRDGVRVETIAGSSTSESARFSGGIPKRLADATEHGRASES